uniref:Hydrophobic seed protein domain-containing protein n=1 Tax=Leersia perrieri TaxID=77586 RepID=A0A0D9VVD9_9ORYZ
MATNYSCRFPTLAQLLLVLLVFLVFVSGILGRDLGESCTKNPNQSKCAPIKPDCCI